MRLSKRSNMRRRQPLGRTSWPRTGWLARGRDFAREARAGRRHDPSSRHSCSRRPFPTVRRPGPGRAALPPGPPEPTRRCRALGGARTCLPGPRPARRGRDQLALCPGAAPRGRGPLQRSRSGAIEQGRLEEALDCLLAATRLRLDYPEAAPQPGHGPDQAGQSPMGPRSASAAPRTSARRPGGVLPPGRRLGHAGRVRPGCRMLSPGRPAPARTGPGVAQPGPRSCGASASTMRRCAASSGPCGCVPRIPVRSPNWPQC